MAYLDQFTKSIRSNYQFMRMGVASGLSANKILASMKNAGIGVKRQDGLKAIKAIRSSYSDVSNYTTSDPTQKPIAELIPPSLTDQFKRYRYVVEGDMFNPTLSVEYKKHVTIESNYLLEQGDVLSMGRELIRGGSADFNAVEGEVRISLIEDSFAPVIIKR